MYKPLSVLVLVALCVGVVHFWDFAMASGNRIDFFKNDTITHSVSGVQFKSLTALAYDAFHDTLLFVDQQTDNSSVYRFNFSSNDIQPILTRKQIESIAYDPVEDLLFWLQERIIFSTHLNSGFKSVVSNQNLVIKLHDEIPSHIAVDSCEGFVYWTNRNIAKPTIERVRFDGSVREVVLDKDIHEPHHLVIDPLMKKMFWIDIRHNEPNNYNLKSAYLNGTNEGTLATGNGNIPKALTVSDHIIYFSDRRSYELLIYKLTKFERNFHIVHSPKTEGPNSIVAKYTLEEQTKGIYECEALSSLLQDNSVNERLTCVHGVKANGTSCTCAPGYIGERCDVSVCHNYCIQGTCSVSDEGEPSCGCESGYSGARCDINMCFNYCLNNGVCYFNEENKPFCKCSGNYSGSRCEAIENDTVTVTVNSGDKNITLPKSADNNCTLADVLLNRRKIAAKVTVKVKIQSKINARLRKTS